MQALINKKYDGRNLKLGRLLGDYGAYKRYMITYRVTGSRSRASSTSPTAGALPVLVLNHGYIDPDTYFPARACHANTTTWRVMATSCCTRTIAAMRHLTTTRTWITSRLPYAIDTINAVKAVKSSKLRFLDKDRVGWLGRSMGGGVTLTALVAQPGLVDAAAIYASVSSLAADNWKKFYRPSQDRSRANRRIARTYGLPDESPEFWRAASPRPYFGRVTEPLLVHHGTRDDTCPIRWSEATVKAPRAAGKDVTIIKYRGEATFERQWQRSIERTVAFFDKNLK
jgi:dienelactone hydrolase